MELEDWLEEDEDRLEDELDEDDEDRELEDELLELDEKDDELEDDDELEEDEELVDCWAKQPQSQTDRVVPSISSVKVPLRSAPFPHGPLSAPPEDPKRKSSPASSLKVTSSQPEVSE